MEGGKEEIFSSDASEYDMEGGKEEIFSHISFY